MLDCQNGCSSHVPKQDPETLNPLQQELIFGMPKECHVEKPSTVVKGLGFRALDGTVPVPVDPIVNCKMRSLESAVFLT